ncbi:MauE/DoxX family redox-associated membrane protein [Streptomyces sp. NPDC048349]|uniref:MauE/DoxX family redox-associated membrane protein n=1 Tax=Streptomyces sp. NPDC048349 TaxID=3155486 RepID=UPI00341B3E90
MLYLAIGMRCLIGAVFLVSVLGKTAGRGAYAAFVVSVRELLPLSRTVTRPAAALVVLGEAAIVPLLALPQPLAHRTGFALAAALLTAFTGAVARSLRQGSRTPCRCFGASATPLGPRHLVRNLFLAAGATAGAVAAGSAGALHPGGALAAAFAGLLLGALVTLLDDLLYLLRPAAV